MSVDEELDRSPEKISDSGRLITLRRNGITAFELWAFRRLPSFDFLLPGTVTDRSMTASLSSSARASRNLRNDRTRLWNSSLVRGFTPRAFSTSAGTD